MRSANWKDAVELIGIAAIVASLIFVGLELRQSQRIALVESAVNRSALNAEVDNAIIENIEIWRKGNSGEELTPSEVDIYRELFENYTGQQWLRWFSNSQLDFDPRVAIADLAAYLSENPGALREWQRIQDRFSKQRRANNPKFEDPFAAAVDELITQEGVPDN